MNSILNIHIKYKVTLFISVYYEQVNKSGVVQQKFCKTEMHRIDPTQVLRRGG